MAAVAEVGAVVSLATLTLRPRMGPSEAIATSFTAVPWLTGPSKLFTVSAAGVAAEAASALATLALPVFSTIRAISVGAASVGAAAVALAMAAVLLLPPETTATAPLKLAAAING